MSLERIEDHPTCLVLEPRSTFDRALLGVTVARPVDDWPRDTDTPCAVYSSAACVLALMDAEDMDEDEAREWFYYNTRAAWKGEGTPTFIEDDEDNVCAF